MNRKTLLIAVTVLAVAGAGWAGRTFYRVRKNIVTLDVYNAPLAQVVKQLERQTRETILVSTGVESKVTLTLRNVPLDEALDRLSRQAGAHWSKWHAVHGSSRALDKLESALRNRTKIEDAGWTNITPRDLPGGFHSPLGAVAGASAGIHQFGGGATVVRSSGKPVTIELKPEDVKDGNVEAAMREKLRAAGVNEAAINRASSSFHQNAMEMNVQNTGGTNTTSKSAQPRQQIRMVSRGRGPSGEVMEEVWSPEHVVLDQRLSPKLGDQQHEDAGEAIARKISQKVNGDMTTLYVLRKMPGGIPFGGSMTRQIHRGATGGTDAIAGLPQPLPDIESAVKRAEAERYVRLTPEQRVQRLRERMAAKAKP